jgi:hypothetical protein
MLRLDKQHAEAITRLLRNEDFKLFVELLAVNAEELNKALIMKTHENSGQMYALQGHTRGMVTLLETINDAPSTLKKLTNPQRE